MLDLNTMILFEKVATEGSFSGAARVLGVPTSTLSRKLSELEADVGTLLLQRTSRRLTLTDAGRRYLEHCRRVVDEVERADVALRNLQTVPRGNLRLTSSPLFGDVFLGPVIAEYISTYPDVSVEVVHTQARVDLIKEGIDLAIRIRQGRLADSSLVARRLGVAPITLCASPDYVARKGKPQVPKDLIDHDCIVVGDATSSGGATWTFEPPDEGPVEVSLSPRFRCNTYPIALQAALAGAGIARLPAYLADEYYVGGQLVPVLNAQPSAKRTVYAVYPARDHLALTVRTFIDLLVERLVPKLKRWDEWTDEDR